jgi:O-antigen/teichoic acid export membrane protein
MQIGKRDIIWSYAATFLQIASTMLLFPFILRILPQETIAIWTIFSTIIVLISLLDFGFNPSFTRNVTYIFSGIKELKKTGFYTVKEEDKEIDYGLLKGLINVMRLFYLRIAVMMFIAFATIGTYYIYVLLKTYSNNHTEVYISWIILCSINTYSFYTLYYDSLLQGRGLIKRSKQIVVVGQLIYVIGAIIFILLGFGLIAIVSSQALSVLIKRIASYRSFYTRDMMYNLQHSVAKSGKTILQAIYPNAVKVGLTGIGTFLVSRSAIIIGSLYLSLNVMASYGITIQIINVISGISRVYFSTYQPQIVQRRVQNDTIAIKNIYLKSCIFLFSTYIAGGLSLLFLGDLMLSVIGSKTPFLNRFYIVIILIISLLETNHATAGGILVTKNEVPYFKAALIFGGFTIILLFIFFRYTNLGVLGMIIAPGIAQGCYQNWKWPLVVIKELKIKKQDIYDNFYDIVNRFL